LPLPYLLEVLIHVSFPNRTTAAIVAVADAAVRTWITVARVHAVGEWERFGFVCVMFVHDFTSLRPAPTGVAVADHGFARAVRCRRTSAIVFVANIILFPFRIPRTCTQDNSRTNIFYCLQDAAHIAALTDELFLH